MREIQRELTAVNFPLNALLCKASRAPEGFGFDTVSIPVPQAYGDDGALGGTP
jgi:hypothetical protein